MIKVKIQVLNCSGHLEVNVSERILNRIKNIFGTGVATRVETGIVQLKLATGILNDRIARVHNYGFMSRPLPGAKGWPSHWARERKFGALALSAPFI